MLLVKWLSNVSCEIFWLDIKLIHLFFSICDVVYDLVSARDVFKGANITAVIHLETFKNVIITALNIVLRSFNQMFVYHL